MRHSTQLRKPRVSSAVALAVVVAAVAAAGAAHADVDIDLGRGPVTVHVPESYNPSQPAPLVMLLHAFAANGQVQEAYMDLLPWSERLGFLYVFPDGSMDDTGARFWNATDACCDYDGVGVDDSGYLRALIDAIIDELNVDTEQIFVLGHSNGGFMAYRMACDHADIIAAVASLAGATYADPGSCTPSAPVRTLQIHGTGDFSLDYMGGSTGMGAYPGALETTEQWAAYNNCSMVPDTSLPPLDLDSGLPGFETTITRFADGCDPGGSAELWTIVDGDHSPALSHDFALLVLDFFFSGSGQGGLLTERQFIPAAAYAAGAGDAFFQTDIDVTNTADSVQRFRFLWLPRGEDNSEPLTSDEFVLDARKGVRYTNAVGEIFGLAPGAVGAIAIEASSPDVIFMSRTYNVDRGGSGGTFGQAVPAIPEREMIPGDGRRHIVFGSEGEDYRTNIGCLNAGRSTAVVYFELFDQEGASLELSYLVLDPWGNDQLNRVFAAHGPVRGSVEVSVPGANTRCMCYGSVIDNITDDPITILPQ